MWTVPLPVWIQVSKKTKFYLNLNPFRNANFHTLNKAKIKFAEQVSPLLRSIPVMKTVGLTFTLYTGNQQLCDISNVCSIVDKFFTDTLVASGKIKDDNYEVVVSVRYRFGGIIKGAPRVDVLITPNPELEIIQEEIMKITIDQVEIEQAIKAYIGGQIAIREDQRVDIDLKAGRGENGFSASIDIVAANAPVKAPEVEQTAKPKPVTPPVTTQPVEQPAADPVKVEPTTETVEQPNDIPLLQNGTPLPFEPTANPETEVAATPVVEQPAKRTSLFGSNLKKPQN